MSNHEAVAIDSIGPVLKQYWVIKRLVSAYRNDTLSELIYSEIDEMCIASPILKFWLRTAAVQCVTRALVVQMSQRVTSAAHLTLFTDRIKSASCVPEPPQPHW